MKITIIVATDVKGGIGYKNTIPWFGKTPSDMRHFRTTTTGHTVIMGKNTFLSLVKPLPNRTNIVLSRTGEGLPQQEIIVCSSLNEALEKAGESFGNEEVFIIGGEQIYKQVLPIADKILLTQIQEEFTTDTAFPLIDQTIWSMEMDQIVDASESDKYDMHFLTYVRKR